MPRILERSPEAGLEKVEQGIEVVEPGIETGLLPNTLEPAGERINQMHEREKALEKAVEGFKDSATSFHGFVKDTVDNRPGSLRNISGIEVDSQIRDTCKKNGLQPSEGFKYTF